MIDPDEITALEARLSAAYDAALSEPEPEAEPATPAPSPADAKLYVAQYGADAVSVYQELMAAPTAAAQLALLDGDDEAYQELLAQPDGQAQLGLLTLREASRRLTDNSANAILGMFDRPKEATPVDSPFAGTMTGDVADAILAMGKNPRARPFALADVTQKHGQMTEAKVDAILAAASAPRPRREVMADTTQPRSGSAALADAFANLGGGDATEPTE